MARHVLCVKLCGEVETAVATEERQASRLPDLVDERVDLIVKPDDLLCGGGAKQKNGSKGGQQAREEVSLSVHRIPSFPSSRTLRNASGSVKVCAYTTGRAVVVLDSCE
jgi:hypothetical protein